MRSIGAGTRLCCIFGRPVAHSLSPAMQNAAFESAGIDAVYLAFEPSSIDAAIGAMRALPIHGASVTIPFKTEIMPLLDAIDPLAEKIGAVNTLLHSGGRIIGDNTDGHGASLALAGKGVAVRGARVLIVGNGGSARAIAFTLLEEGGSVCIAGRNGGRVAALAGDLQRHFSGVDCLLLRDLTPEFTEDINIIINATPVGMAPRADERPRDASLLHRHHAVMDIVYSPRTTKLLSLSAAKGCATVGGIDMLLHQGARQFEIWTGKPAPLEAMRKALGSAHGT